MQQAQIAQECRVSVRTVENNISLARKRLGTTTTAQTLIQAIAREEIGMDHNRTCFIPDLGS